jgi:hypothetical protein
VRRTQPDVAFVIEASIAWVVLAAVYVYWRHLAALMLHLLVPISNFLFGLLAIAFDGEVDVHLEEVLIATFGAGCWAASIFSFQVSIAHLAPAAIGSRLRRRGSERR